jgi:2-polyprenyl-3-methyl-5-hydroxy-6-metoxy-1,4-benzoquinol methylase
MDEIIKIVSDFYDTDVLAEWNRLDGRPEFLLSCRMLDRYIKPNNKILDIGGGPGRYSLYLAEKGCDVTLLDLSPQNVKFADEQAAKQRLSLHTTVGDAREADYLIEGLFDNILLMGPMYHLLEESDRIKAVNAALNLLKTGGVLFISFLNLYSRLISGMKDDPDFVYSDFGKVYIDALTKNQNFKGDLFFFMKQDEILPFMSSFSLEKLHFYGQESITSPCENNIMSQTKELVNLWLDICETILERDELLSWSEHLMYVGRKI